VTGDMEYFCTRCAELLTDYYTRRGYRFCDEDCADAWDEQSGETP
jgi:hypothetical protein